MGHTRLASFILSITLWLGACTPLAAQGTALALLSTPTPALETSALPPTVKAPTSVPLGINVTCTPASFPFEHLRSTNPIEYATSMYPNVPIARVCSFSGEVNRGDFYEHVIESNMILCLVPGSIWALVPDSGWGIVVTDAEPGSCDPHSPNAANFGPIVTPPWHNNPGFDVLGSDFRNAANTGPNDGSVNAPQHERYFNFLFSRSDYYATLHGQSCLTWKLPDDCAMATQYPWREDIPHSTAKFTVNDIRLGNLSPATKAWIEHLNFTVDVYLPAK